MNWLPLDLAWKQDALNFWDHLVDVFTKQPERKRIRSYRKTRKKARYVSYKSKKL